MPVKKVHLKTYAQALEHTRRFTAPGYADEYVRIRKAKGFPDANRTEAYNIIRGIAKSYDKLNDIRAACSLPMVYPGQSIEFVDHQGSDIVNSLQSNNRKTA